MTTIIRNSYVAKQRHSSAKRLNREKKMTAICILAMFTCDVTQRCIACHR